MAKVNKDVNCKYVKREGESCTLNDNCRFPDCPEKISVEKQFLDDREYTEIELGYIMDQEALIKLLKDFKKEIQEQIVKKLMSELGAELSRLSEAELIKMMS